MNDFRERKMNERARRIAGRIRAAGGMKAANAAAARTPLDLMVAPGGGQWRAPEPPLESPGIGAIVQADEE